MLIRTRLGVTVDGFIATRRHACLCARVLRLAPVQRAVRRRDHGALRPRLRRALRRLAMARQAGLCPDQPTGPENIPADVVVAAGAADGLRGRLRSANLQRDALLLGGLPTLQAFLAIGDVDRLEHPPWPRPCVSFFRSLTMADRSRHVGARRPADLLRRYDLALVHLRRFVTDQARPTFARSESLVRCGISLGQGSL